MKLDQALAHATTALSFSESARLEAELILSDVLKCSRASLIAHEERELTELEMDQVNRLLLARQEREPMAYLLGHKEFWSLDLQVTPATLIPRPETELLVEQVLALFPEKNEKRLVADLGTGSGALALALAQERPQWEIIATDQSPDALKIASHNARKLNCPQIRFCQGSWYQALPKQRFDVLVSNPPYLSESEWQQAAKELYFEPYKALVAGEEGYAALRELVQGAKDFLLPGGYLLLEHGSTQATRLREIFQSEGFNEVSTYQDLAGLDRVTLART